MQSFGAGIRSLPEPGLNLAAAREWRERIANAGLSENTLRDYRSSWKSFSSWCGKAQREPLPADPQTLIDHAAWCIAEGYRLETVNLRMQAVNFYHRRENLPLPFDRAVRIFLQNARRALNEKPQGKAALAPEQVKRMARRLLDSGTVRDLRDRAIILLGFASGWRSAELMALDLEDVRRVKHGLVLSLGKSKTDQEGRRGRITGVRYGASAASCPVRALKDWLDVRGKWDGPLFARLDPHCRLLEKRLAPDGVRRAVLRGLERIGEDPKPFGGHSLRVGFVTSAIENGASETTIMLYTGHQTYGMIRRYARPVNALRSNPLRGVL